MLPPSHNRAYQDWLTLLTELQSFLSKEKISPLRVKQEFHQLKLYFEQQIISIDEEDLSEAIASRWQSVQTEIKREFKLLSTDILFLSSARQISTQNKRVTSISDRLTKLIGYCHIMLNTP